MIGVGINEEKSKIKGVLSMGMENIVEAIENIDIRSRYTWLFPNKSQFYFRKRVTNFFCLLLLTPY